MAWQKITDDVATTDRATSAYATQQVVENQAALEDGHARSVGHTYGTTAALRLQPPLTTGPLGPVMIPFVAPRPAHAARIEVRLRVQAPDDGPVLVRPWVMADGQLLSAASSTSVPDDAMQDLLVSVDVRGRDSTGSEWVVCAWGLTVDEGTSVQVSEDGGVNFQEVVAEQPGGLSGNGLILSGGGVEYALPTGQVVYIGSTAGSQPNATALFFPPMSQAFPLSTGNVDTFGTLLPRVEVVSWSVAFRNAAIRQAPYVDGGALMQVGDIPALRRRTLEGWAAQSQWWAAGPERQEPELHGRPEHVDGDCVSVPMPHHLLLAGVSGAALVQSWGGSRSVDMRTRVEELDTDGTVLSTEADETTAQRTQALGLVPTTMPAFVRRFGSLPGWSARDAFFSGDIAALDLLTTGAPVGAPDTDEWRVRLAVDFGAARGHVAAVSLVEVVEIDDGQEVVVLGLATIWEAVDFAARPSAGLRIDDELITTDTGNRWRWNGSLWLLIDATVATWANRPLPSTLPAGAGLASGARLTVTAAPNASITWNATATAWDVAPGSAYLADFAFPGLAVEYPLFDSRFVRPTTDGGSLTGDVQSTTGFGNWAGTNRDIVVASGVQHLTGGANVTASGPTIPKMTGQNRVMVVHVSQAVSDALIQVAGAQITPALSMMFALRYKTGGGVDTWSRRIGSDAGASTSDYTFSMVYDSRWFFAESECNYNSSTNNIEARFDGGAPESRTLTFASGTGAAGESRRTLLSWSTTSTKMMPTRYLAFFARAAAFTDDERALIEAIMRPIRDL